MRTDGKQELGTRFGMPDDYRGEFWGVRLWEGMRKSRGVFFSSSSFFFNCGCFCTVWRILQKAHGAFTIKKVGGSVETSSVTQHQQNIGKRGKEKSKPKVLWR